VLISSLFAPRFSLNSARHHRLHHIFPSVPARHRFSQAGGEGELRSPPKQRRENGLIMLTYSLWKVSDRLFPHSQCTAEIRFAKEHLLE
jgi:hypothetical protein